MGFRFMTYRIVGVCLLAPLLGCGGDQDGDTGQGHGADTRFEGLPGAQADGTGSQRLSLMAQRVVGKWVRFWYDGEKKFIIFRRDGTGCSWRENDRGNRKAGKPLRWSEWETGPQINGKETMIPLRAKFSSGNVDEHHHLVLGEVRAEDRLLLSGTTDAHASRSLTEKGCTYEEPEPLVPLCYEPSHCRSQQSCTNHECQHTEPPPGDWARIPCHFTEKTIFNCQNTDSWTTEKSRCVHVLDEAACHELTRSSSSVSGSCLVSKVFTDLVMGSESPCP